VLIVTCPCALSLATPAATLAAAGALARRGVLVRRLEALEAGAAIDTVVFDKTGTLTLDRMAGRPGRARADLAAGEALRLAALLARHSLHPVSRALAAASDEEGWATDVREFPGEGVQADVDGVRLRLGSATFCGVPAAGVDATAQVHLA